MPRRSRTLALYIALLVPAAAGLFPLTERTYEFDAGNFRLRYCERGRAWLFGVVVWERCEPPMDHPTAVRLRQLGGMDAPDEARARWVLIKGFRPGVRGWHGDGKEFLRGLGPTSFGTPVPLPVNEELAQNGWVRWAAHDPAASRRFWRRVQTARDRGHPLRFVAIHGRQYLETHPMPADEAELEELVVRDLESAWGGIRRRAAGATSAPSGPGPDDPRE
jgi:hypothetical protein